MSDAAPTDPNAQAPEQVTDTTADEPTPIHPAWESALAVVPESLRGGIYDQIRTTERESQRAIEQARQNSIDPQWREFAEAAKQNQIDPSTLVEAYNISRQLSDDPIGFQQRLNSEIDAAVANGTLTRAEGQQAKREVNAEVTNELDGLETPEQKEIRELRAQVEGITGNLTAQQQEAEQARVTAASNAYYDEFQQTVENAFTAAGYPDVKPETKVAVMRMADSALNGDITDSLTLQQAVQGALNSLLAFRNQQATTSAPSVQQGQQPLPIGGGGQPAGQQPQKFDNTPAGRQAREAAMLAEAQRIFAQ